MEEVNVEKAKAEELMEHSHDTGMVAWLSQGSDDELAPYSCCWSESSPRSSIANFSFGNIAPVPTDGGATGDKTLAAVDACACPALEVAGAADAAACPFVVRRTFIEFAESDDETSPPSRRSSSTPPTSASSTSSPPARSPEPAPVTPALPPGKFDASRAANHAAYLAHAAAARSPHFGDAGPTVAAAMEMRATGPIPQTVDEPLAAPGPFAARCGKAMLATPGTPLGALPWSAFGCKDSPPVRTAWLAAARLPSPPPEASPQLAIVAASQEPSLHSPVAETHAAGSCRPCAFFAHGLCGRGTDCAFCHEHVQVAWRKCRPPKHIRKRIKAGQIAGAGASQA